MSTDPFSRRPLFAPRGVVATSQPLAASAGLAVLRRGGNAIGAAVATAIALTADAVHDLRRRGHRVDVVDSPGAFGDGRAIWRTDAGYVAGSEPRADGVAVGF